jgi:prevent-host-death family protein
MYILYMSIEMNMTDARRELPDITNRAEYVGETTYLTKHGRRTAAVVPAASAELLEDLENLIDGEQVRQVLEALADGAEKTVPYRRRTARRDG